MTNFQKISTFLFILIFLTGAYAQDVDRDLFLKHHASSQINLKIPHYINHSDVIKHPFYRNEEGVDRDVFENQANQILKAAILDSTSVVDSVITKTEWGYVEIYKYQYNSLGNIISLNINDTIGFENSRIVYEYNSKNNVTSEINEEWVFGNRDSYYKFVYEYNQNDSLVNKSEYFWINNEWFHVWRDIREYDNNGNKIGEHSETWNNGVWDTTGIPRNYSYDNENRLISESFRYEKEWGGGGEIHTYYTYDENSHLITSLSKDYSYDSGQWYNSQLKEYQFNENGDLAKILSKRWLEGWRNNVNEIFEYNSNRELTSWIYQTWDTSWVNNSRHLLNYDSKGNKISEYYETWDGTTWVYHYNYARILFNYDENSNCILGLFALWNGTGWGATKGDLIFQDSFGRTFNFHTFELNVFYIPFNTTEVVSNKNSNLENFQLEQNYPNPFNPSTTINYNIPSQSIVTLKVYDVLGKEVATLVNKEQTAGSYEVEFDSTNLTSGIYFYRIQAKQFVETKKMVLVR